MTFPPKLPAILTSAHAVGTAGSPALTGLHLPRLLVLPPRAVRPTRRVEGEGVSLTLLCLSLSPCRLAECSQGLERT